MTNNHDNSEGFQHHTEWVEKKTIIDVLCELAAQTKAAITLVYYLLLLTISLGLSYIVIRITIWAVTVVIDAAGL